MSTLFTAIITFFLWSIFIIFLYYTQNSSHISLISGTNSAILLFYLIGIAIAYGWYKVCYSHEKKSVSWNAKHFVSGFFISLFVAATAYSLGKNNSEGFSGAIVLFLHLLQYIFYPIILVMAWRGVGNHLGKIFSQWKNYPLRLTIPAEIALGMGIFWVALFIRASFQFLHAGVFWGFFAIFLLLGNHKNTYLWLKNEKITFENTTFHSLKAMSTEILYLVFCFVASTSLISTLRPMPIWWDDLGVYMNFPRIIAETGNVLEWAGMYLWHMITASGFIVQGPTQAFFVNQIGGFLATATIISALSLFQEKILPKKEGETTIFCLPILLGIIYYLMPMTIFQQAKDMKLDPALMFVSVSAIMLAIYAGKKYLRNTSERSTEKEIFSILGIAGMLVGIAFSIKFTTLMLIISAIAFLGYIFLGFWGFIGFFGLFMAVFTEANLWSFLFVWMPENTIFITTISLSISIFGFYKSLQYSQIALKKYLIACGYFLLWSLLFVFPWLVKNTVEVINYQNSSENFSIGINEIMNGKWGNFFSDYSKIFSAEELASRQKNLESSNTTEDGQTLNEDFSRYFGHEKGLNNYIKIPFNLTLQKNQAGEFTDITYIFLAFVPVALLFFRANRQKSWMFLVIGFLVFALIINIPVFSDSQIWKFISGFFANITLARGGYLVLLALICSLLFSAEKFLKKDTPEEKIILAILYLTGMYGLIFWISAFGIVWYGILLYFLFFLIILVGFSRINTVAFEENPHSTPPVVQTKIHTQKRNTMIIFFVFLGIYIFGSAILHTTKTLGFAWFDEYKYKKVSGPTAILSTKPEYVVPLLTLNLENTEGILRTIILDIENGPLLKNPTLKDIWDNSIEKNNLQSIRWFLEAISFQIMVPESAIAKNLLNTLDFRILHPWRDNRNNAPIYRIGTFMTYFIYNNRARYYEDSLLFNYKAYFADENPDVVAARMKKLGIKYLLVDLNAATIDRDQNRHELTNRYENLLLATRSEKFRLISSDSVCLQLALDWHHSKKISREKFLNLAGVSYTSYDKNNNSISSPSKKRYCAEAIIEALQSGNVPPTLSSLSQQMGAHGSEILGNAVNTNFFALFEIQ